MDEDEQDGEEDGEEESEERDGDHERRLNEKDPRKSEGQSLGGTDDASTLNENSKRSVTGPCGTTPPARAHGGRDLAAAAGDKSRAGI